MLDKHRCMPQVAQFALGLDEKMDRYAVLFVLLPLSGCDFFSWTFEWLHPSIKWSVSSNRGAFWCVFSLHPPKRCVPSLYYLPQKHSHVPQDTRKLGHFVDVSVEARATLTLTRTCCLKFTFQSASILQRHNKYPLLLHISFTHSFNFVPPGAATKPRSQLSTARTWLGPVRALGGGGWQRQGKSKVDWWITVFFVWSSSGQTFFELEVWIDSVRDWRLGRGTLRPMKSSANWNSQRPLAQPVLSRETGQAYTWLPLDFQRFGCGCMISTFLNRPNCYSGLEFSAWDNNRPISSFRQDSRLIYKLRLFDVLKDFEWLSRGQAKKWDRTSLSPWKIMTRWTWRSFGARAVFWHRCAWLHCWQEAAEAVVCGGALTLWYQIGSAYERIWNIPRIDESPMQLIGMVFTVRNISE